VSFTKAAEPIEIPFGVWTAVGKRNHVSDRGPDTHNGRGNFQGVWPIEKSIVKHRVLRTGQNGELCKNR